MKAKKVTALVIAASMAFAASTNAFAANLKKAVMPNKNIKNIIVMIADGMSNDGVTLTRWYNSYDPVSGIVDTTKSMAMDEMASGLVRTWWLNKGVVGAITDSAPAGTALATGVKTNNKFIGVTDQKAPLATILEAAKLAGKSTGLISTSQIMHATPAAYSSHYPDRSKEYIIAEQQVYNNIDIMLGGGYGRLSERPDEENLLDILKENNYTYITDKAGLENINGKTWGMFAKADMSYEMDRTENNPSQPSLSEMTSAAINTLSQDKDGFFMMVEGSKVDWAAHSNDPIGLISDINAFDKAVKVALDFAKKDGNTMVIAITDHGNGGVSIGNADTTKTYDSDPIVKFIAPLKKARLTGEGLEAKFNEDKSNIVEVMAQYYGINDLTDEEIQAIKKAESGSMNKIVGPMISKRAFLGWTTGGHTGEEIVLYTYLPGDDRITGTIDNTDIANICAGVWGLNLKATTDKLYNNAKVAFNAKGATVETDSSNPENQVMIITKGEDKIEIPENKNYVFKNGEKVITPGINVNVEGTFYVSKEVIDLI